MKAMILAAGLGTRLKPLSAIRPKPLMPVVNEPLISRIIQYLKTYGIREMIVNAHHHHQQIANHLDDGRPFGIPIHVRVETKILGTGGGIKNTADFWDDEPFIVINGDILCDINLTEAVKSHKVNHNLATLVLHDFAPFNQIKIDGQMNVQNISISRHKNRLAFTGIHIIEPELLDFIKGDDYSDIIDHYRVFISEDKPIRAYVAKGHYWRDIGTIESYILANKDAMGQKSFFVDTDCRLDPSARMSGWAVIGGQSILEEDVQITRSILWENVTVKKGVKVIDSIVTSQKVVKNDMINQII